MNEIYAPMPEPKDVRASGGIVHSDGNVFFTNIEKMKALFFTYADATHALREAQREPLTDEQREEIAKQWRGRNWTLGDIISATERAITGQSPEE